MARNPVQFQKGLSLSEFNARYGREKQCHAALIEMRWPEGFVCPKCGGRRYSYAKARRIFQCSACRTQTSVKAGTIFHKSRTPLVKWFLAIYLLTQSKNDIAALELARQLGVKWDTAWLIKQKLMETMRLRNRNYKLKGDVQLDDAYLGGEKPGKRGRGAANKIPFVIAVQTREDKPIYTQLRCVAGFTNSEIKAYAAASIEAGSPVATDGLACFAALTSAGMMHRPIVTAADGPTNPNSNGSTPGSETSRAPSPEPAAPSVRATPRDISQPMNTASTAVSNSTRWSSGLRASRRKLLRSPATSYLQR